MSTADLRRVHRYGRHVEPDEEASRLYEAHAFALARARRLIQDSHTAQDVAQDAMIRLLVQDSPPANIEAWLTRVVTNLANDHHRQQNRRQPPPGAIGEGGLPEERDLLDRGLAKWVSGPALDAIKLQNVLDSLNQRERQILTLHLQGWTNSEIADELGYANEASVRTQLSRTKSRIRGNSMFGTDED